MRAVALLLAASALAASAPPAAADDGWGFRRTTPRAELAVEGDQILLGVPGGRAWGIQSALQPVPAAPAILRLGLSVREPSVREAFVRVAYYGTFARSRQIAIVDSEAVVPGDGVTVAVRIDPPPGAVAYRLRVLARLMPGAERSAAESIAVEDLHWAARPALTRLEP
jgi:hypothetical protein